jgi:hypothetical protein
MSFAAINIPNLDIGPCQVFYNGVDLGSTLNKVVVAPKYHKAPLKADQTGDTILDQAIHGIDITVTTELAETRDKTKWQVVFPTAVLAGVFPADFLTFNEATSVRDLTRAQSLLLHPLVESDTGFNKDHFFYKVLATEESSLTIGPAEQYKLKIVWRVYPDITTTPFRFYRYGDHTL